MGGGQEGGEGGRGTKRVPTFQASARWPVAPVSKAGEPQWILDVNMGKQQNWIGRGTCGRHRTRTEG